MKHIETKPPRHRLPVVITTSEWESTPSGGEGDGVGLGVQLAPVGGGMAERRPSATGRMCPSWLRSICAARHRDGMAHPLASADVTIRFPTVWKLAGWDVSGGAVWCGMAVSVLGWMVWGVVCVVLCRMAVCVAISPKLRPPPLLPHTDTHTPGDSGPLGEGLGLRGEGVGLPAATQRQKQEHGYLEGMRPGVRGS